MAALAVLAALAALAAPAALAALLAPWAACRRGSGPVVLPTAVRRAAGELAGAVLSLRPLLDVLDPPAVVPGGPGGSAAVPVLHRLADRLRVRRPEVDPDLPRAGSSLFGRVLGDRLALADRPALGGVGPADLPELDEVADEVAAGDFGTFCREAVVRSRDGTPLRVLSAGPPGRAPVVLVPACGTPARLSERWVRRLARDRPVLTWETRGLFLDRAGFAAATTLAAQVEDLLAVVDRAGPGPVHLVGLCGGAVLALAATRLAPDRVASLSLWHGDWELGDAAPKTDHQRNLKAMMALAARAGDRAADVHGLLSRSVGDGVPADLAHLVLYPYATPELMVRYCRLNGAIMDAEVSRWLGAGPVPPALVVTSADDHTAHPEGSRHVAARLPGARLLVTGSGDHLSLFRSGSDHAETAARFAAEHDRAGARAAQL